MYDFILGGISGKVGKWDSVSIDNIVFRLHYRVTFLILIAGSLLVTSKQYIGDPIDCMVGDGKIGKVMDIYCWIHSTFSVPTRVGSVPGVDQVQPGVAPLNEGPYQHHKYYQWVVFVLTLQAFFFYTPRIIWKTIEGGVMKTLVSDLNDVTAFLDKTNRQDGVERIKKYFSQWRGRGGYFFKFFLCELLNFLNVLGQIYFTDRFLEYQFRHMGWR